ncbi:FecR family protein [Limibacterium fermenti]|jgi:ferric-dicitrate binding protein FerR (iron transport regulator)|uniref:FecR family protein n=1 Tax=Limibacterium fermenti TaxID=3229863 RepID=UPI000E9513DB|nr:hypothetical protein [Porphyromonadaceae bacterium]HBX21837.1 hypothetical protein [Porphyromonadaceae bacterium]HBX44615.1 hypothetical protein [Porphyromonadaceae bacterium]HCM21806.1 hypothetical protein [Porphyromonadaceae bacterium]
MKEDSSENMDLLIVKYLDNEIDIHEKEVLDRWVSTSKENERHFIRMAKTWEQTIIRLQNERSASEHYMRFQQLLLRRKRKMHKIVYRISAVAAVLLLLSIMHFFVVPSLDDPLLTEVTFNQKKEIVLPDGSVVWLNKNSTLEYRKKFLHDRNVHITGEAYFDVTPDKKHPFTVKASDITIKVMGTEFTITNYSDEASAETVLKSGCIQLTTPKTEKEILLRPGQMVSYDKASGNVELKSVDPANFTGWINDRLVFQNTPLRHVFTQLEKWYGIAIECTDPALLQTPVSFTVDSETKEEILNTLQVIAPFAWKEQNSNNENSSTIIILPMKDKEP